MSRDNAPAAPEDRPEAAEDVTFLQRWSERKLRARQADTAPPEPPAPEPPVQALTDVDMPPLESLDEHSDYSGFFSPKVSAELRRRALRKLFHSPAFNVMDKLDIYAEDYTHFEALGDVVTQEMRYRMETEARRLAQAVVDHLRPESENAAGNPREEPGNIAGEPPGAVQSSPAAGGEEQP